MSKENIVRDKEKFKEIMKNLDNSIKSAFIRVSTREKEGILDADLINMTLSDAPISIAVRDDGNINVFDSGESNFVIEMTDFDYADIQDMEKESTFGFLRTPCKAISIWLKNTKFIVIYYWTEEKENK
ncbi:MAG: hypothetical protein IJE43_03030 [Alphaproteobacteria bacterium]|nr:hypothetical protein [Alphaproteobacteria bacterium]MBQ6886261.1 hypothetical protein [Lachnospiraceae bacterium]